MEKIYGDIPRMENSMLVSELESKLAKLPQTAVVKISLDGFAREIQTIRYEELEFTDDINEKEIITLVG